MSERRDHSRNYIGKVRIELCAKSFILQVYDVLARHRSQRFSIVPTGSVSGVIPRVSMTYLVYAYGFDWFVHA